MKLFLNIFKKYVEECKNNYNNKRDMCYFIIFFFNERDLGIIYKGFFFKDKVKENIGILNLNMFCIFFFC